MAASSPSYRGDSPGKKLARVLFWFQALKVMGHSRLREGPHVVLSSRDTGDVATLLALGARPSSIIAVDKDPQACLDVLDQYPGVKAINDDIFEVLKTYRRKAMTIHFDFCGQPSIDLIDRMSRDIAELPNGAYWGASFSYGREKERALSDYETMRKELVDSLRGQQKREDDAEEEHGPRRLYHVAAENSGSRDDMVEYLEDFTNDKEDPFGWRLLLVSQFTLLRIAEYINVGPRRGTCAMRFAAQYTSGTEFSKGMPMMIFAAALGKKMRGESRGMALRRFIELMPEDGSRPIRIGNYTELQFRLFIVDHYDSFRRANLSHENIARLVNIPVELLNTWVGDQS